MGEEENDAIDLCGYRYRMRSQQYICADTWILCCYHNYCYHPPSPLQPESMNPPRTQFQLPSFFRFKQYSPPSHLPPYFEAQISLTLTIRYYLGQTLTLYVLYLTVQYALNEYHWPSQSLDRSNRTISNIQKHSTYRGDWKISSEPR